MNTNIMKLTTTIKCAGFTITVTGEKNAKLICVIYENSSIEDYCKSFDNKNCRMKKSIPTKAISSTEMQTIVRSTTQMVRIINSFKMKRLPKSSK